MPQYLRRVTVRLLEASMESLHLGLVGLGLPVRRESREPSSRYSASVGLVGTAAEQVMAAILVHVYGEDVLQIKGSRFKTAREVLSDFRQLLRNPVPRASFLTAGIPNPEVHLSELLQATSGFTVVIAERAAGLHAGSGPSRDATFVAAKKVHDFLALLARSSRIRAYLDDLPRLPDPVVHPNILVDEIIMKLSTADGLSEKAGLLRSLFIILPEVPESTPDWLDAIERVALAPTDSDVVLLVSALEKAIPVQLQRASAKGQGLSIVVRPDDPSAIPMAAHHLRRSFTQISDQWGADVGNANGRLQGGMLDLPPDDFVLDLFVLGPAELRRVFGKDVFTAHEVWPFIASALIRHGTPGPYWFLVRLTNDLGQLKALMQTAFALGKGGDHIARQRELVDGLKAIEISLGLSAGSILSIGMRQLLDASTKARERLAAAMQRNRGTLKAFPEGGEWLLKDASADSTLVGKAIELMLKSPPEAAATRYWARMLCESASDSLDRHPLVSILRQPTLTAAHTAARKALRLIDAMDNGPSMQLEDA